MGAVYATVSDITVLGRSLTAQEQEAAEVLLEQASAKLRLIAKKYGKNVDELIASDEDYGDAVKNIVVQATLRALGSVTESTPALSQGSETNGSYSIQMTYLNAGQSLYFLRNELKELGILRQRYGLIDIYPIGEE